jgi:hypothetical protein
MAEIVNFGTLTTDEISQVLSEAAMALDVKQIGAALRDTLSFDDLRELMFQVDPGWRDDEA